MLFGFSLREEHNKQLGRRTGNEREDHSGNHGLEQRPSEGLADKAHPGARRSKPRAMPRALERRAVRLVLASALKSFIGAGSAARPGTDQSMVHPHERIEAGERMGEAQAARWRPWNNRI